MIPGLLVLALPGFVERQLGTVFCADAEPGLRARCLRLWTTRRCCDCF